MSLETAFFIALAIAGLWGGFVNRTAPTYDERERRKRFLR